MSDVRLIDANALKSLLIEVLERIKESPKMTRDEMHIISGCHMLCEMIDDAPTIDAVEVVRCRECEDWQRDWVCKRGEDGDHYCAVLDNVFPPDFYCKFGTKMDGGAE